MAVKSLVKGLYTVGLCRTIRALDGVGAELARE